MEEHVVEAEEAPRALFNLARTIWAWAPWYGLVLSVLYAALVVFALSVIPLYATPLVTLHVQNRFVDPALLRLAAPGDNASEDAAVALAQPCQYVVDKGCALLETTNASAPSPANASLVLVEALMQTITTHLTDEGAFDASVLAQGEPYAPTRCVWSSAFAPGTQIGTTSDAVPSRVLAITLQSLTLPEMMAVEMGVGCRVLTAREQKQQQQQRDSTTVLTTYMTAAYRYQSYRRQRRPAALANGQITMSASTGVSSEVMRRDGVARLDSLKFMAIFYLSVACLSLTLVFTFLLSLYASNKREAAVLHALTAPTTTRVVGHVRAPPGALVPRARVRNEYLLEPEAHRRESDEETHEKQGGGEEGAEGSSAYVALHADDAAVEFPYGRGEYQHDGVDDLDDAPTTAEPHPVANAQGALTGTATSPSTEVTSVPDDSPTPHVACNTPVTASSGLPAPSSGANEATSLSGIPLANSHVDASGTATVLFTTSSAEPLWRLPMQHLRARLRHVHQTGLAVVLFTLLLGAMTITLVCVFHLCGTLEHWHSLVFDNMTAGAAVEPHPSSGETSLLFIAMILSWLSTLGVWRLRLRGAQSPVEVF